MNVGRVDPSLVRARVIDAASGPHTFVVGQQLVGRVMDVLSESSLLMAFGDRQVLARTGLPLVKGQSVAVEVTKAGATVELRLQPTVLPDQPRSQQNYELASLLNALGRATGPAPGFDIDVRQRVLEQLSSPAAAHLSRPEAEAIQKLFQPLPGGEDKVLATSLKEWLTNSGLLFESRLRGLMSATPSASPAEVTETLAGDLKVLVGRLLESATLQTAAAAATEAPVVAADRVTRGDVAPERTAQPEAAPNLRIPTTDSALDYAQTGRIAERLLGQLAGATTEDALPKPDVQGLVKLLQPFQPGGDRESLAVAVKEWLKNSGQLLDPRLQGLMTATPSAGPGQLTETLVSDLLALSRALAPEMQGTMPSAAQPGTQASEAGRATTAATSGGVRLEAAPESRVPAADGRIPPAGGETAAETRVASTAGRMAVAPDVARAGVTSTPGAERLVTPGAAGSQDAAQAVRAGQPLAAKASELAGAPSRAAAEIPAFPRAAGDAQVSPTRPGESEAPVEQPARAAQPEELASRVLEQLAGRTAGTLRRADAEALMKLFQPHLAAVDRQALSGSLRQWLESSGTILDTRLQDLSAMFPGTKADQLSEALAADLKEMLGRLVAAAHTPPGAPRAIRYIEHEPVSVPPPVIDASASPGGPAGPEWMAERILTQQAEFAYRWVAEGVVAFDVPLSMPGGTAQARVRFHREASEEPGQPGPSRIDLFVETARLGAVGATVRWRGTTLDATLVVEREGAREVLAERVNDLAQPLGTVFKRVSVDVLVGRVRRPSRTELERPELPGGSVLSVRV